MSRSTIHREPCSDTREGVGEASVAARVGRVLSAETDMFRMCRGSSHGRAIPGYTYAECDPNHMDDTATPITWRGTVSLVSLPRGLSTLKTSRMLSRVMRGPTLTGQAPAQEAREGRTTGIVRRRDGRDHRVETA